MHRLQKITRVDEEVARAGAPQVFALQSGSDLLAKLEWEIEQLRQHVGGLSAEPIAYAAFNCAVAAWQMVDWAWCDDHPGRAPKGREVEEFGDRLRAESRALDICESLANSAKHRARRQKQINAAVSTRMAAAIQHFRCGDPCGRALSAYEWRLTVTFRDQQLPLLGVFDEALAFWNQRMRP